MGPDNGLSPVRFQAIIWANSRLLLIWVLGINFNEMLIKIQQFHSWKWISKCRPQNGGHFVSASMCYHLVVHFCPVAAYPNFKSFSNMTSSNGNILCATGPLWGESPGHRWIPLTKSSDADLWCFLWSAPEQTVEQTIETPMIWDTIALTMVSL